MAKCKVNWLGLAPPDHPIYKEGWTITVQPSRKPVPKAGTANVPPKK